MERTELPRAFTIGDTLTWTESDATYPAPTWTVRYYFTSKTEVFSSNDPSTADGSDHVVTITTTNLKAGTYDYVRKVTDGSELYTTERGQIEVLPDLSADVTGVDRRVYAEKALEAIEAMLLGKASKDQTSYSLNGRALSRYSPAELNEWRRALRIEVAELRAKERRKAGGKSNRNVRVRFTSGSV